jgi:hypothetical protein
MTGMKSEEKAKFLINLFRPYVREKGFFGDNEELKNAKECAKACVEEIKEGIYPNEDNCGENWYWNVVSRKIDDYDD